MVGGLGGRVWRGFTGWLERGDLIPLMVLVSAAHYGVVLAGRDWWPVAVAVGVLVDVGHFRSVVLAVRYRGENLREKVLRWAVAGVMTAISLSYHWRFYGGDLALALPLPLLIAALAYFERTQPAVKANERTGEQGERTAGVRAGANERTNERVIETGERSARAVRAAVGMYDEQVRLLVANDPNVGPSAVARQLGCSKSTASAALIRVRATQPAAELVVEPGNGNGYH